MADKLAVMASSAADYERLGLSPTSIAPWEDGARTDNSGLYVLTLTTDRICAMTRFDNSVLPWFGLPRSLRSR